MNWKIVKLFISNYQFFRTESYGSVDIRKGIYGTTKEREAAEESLKSFGIEIDNGNFVRLITIIEKNELSDAINDADILFEETIDLLQMQPLNHFRNCERAGYFIDLESGTVRPFLKVEKVERHRPSMFPVYYGTYSQIKAQQYIAAGRNDELVKAYLRSINWHKKSKIESRKYLKFLYTWISLETIMKEDKSETNIVPKICLSIGFPRNNDLQFLSDITIRELNSIKNYKAWRKCIFKHVDDSRVFRNKIVHSGFKEADIIDSEDLRKKIYILNTAFNYTIGYIENIIVSGVQSIKNAWTGMRSQIETNSNLKNSIEGTFLYNLDNFSRNDYIFGDD